MDTRDGLDVLEKKFLVLTGIRRPDGPAQYTSAATRLRLELYLLNELDLCSGKQDRFIVTRTVALSSMSMPEGGLSAGRNM